MDEGAEAAMRTPPSTMITRYVLFVVFIVLALLGLPGPCWSQTTLRTPASDDSPCAPQDCQPSSGTTGDNARTVSGADTTAPDDQNDNDAEANGDSDSVDKDNYHGSSGGAVERRQNGELIRTSKQRSSMKTATMPPPPTEFQEFVASSIGRRLPVYGRNLFDHVPTTFAPVDRVPVTDDYRIGPGDEILIRAWGQIDLNGKLVVDRDGAVFLPKVGTLAVAGLKYQQLQEYFRSAIGRVFRNFDLTVSLGQLRSIQIFVVGQALRPGSYTVSSLCTLVNALFASGGPSGTGSMRHIQLKRNDSVITEFDLYDLLLRGDKSKDARLLPGDVIYIPPAGPSIAMAGSVNLPAIYELRERTTLEEAIEMAGGLATTADGQKAVIERIEKHDTRRVEEFSLDEKTGEPSEEKAGELSGGRSGESGDDRGLHRVLQDGDVVRIFSVSPHFANAVTLRGNVAHPGRTEWHSGMHLRDLIPNQDVLVTRNYWLSTNWSASAGERADQEAVRDYWRATQPSSALGWQSRQNGAESAREAPANADGSADESLEGPDERPSGGPQSASGKQKTRAANTRLRNQIARNAAEINWDYAVIQRLNPWDLSTNLVPFNLGKLVLEGDEQNNLPLEPGDVVTIFSQNDLTVPLEKQSKFVRLEGEFRTAGIYQAEPGETVRHLVTRAGGFTANAYLYGAEFTRESVRFDQQKGLNQMVEQLEEDISRNATAPTGISPEEIAANHVQLEAQGQLVEKLRGIKAVGRVVLDLMPTSRLVADLPDIPLEDGDRFVVPYRPATVEMLGAVYNKNSFLYQRDGRVEDYLKRAGGPTRDADKSRIFVIRADGSVLSKQSVKGLWNGGFASLRLMPGDAIVVPERLNHGAFLKGLRDWSQVFSQFALGAAAVRVIQ
jgi:polysaccharide biosynthesis/export protein